MFEPPTLVTRVCVCVCVRGSLNRNNCQLQDQSETSPSPHLCLNMAPPTQGGVATNRNTGSILDHMEPI